MNASSANELNLAICANNPMGVIANLRSMGVEYAEDGALDAQSVLNAVYALDHEKRDCSDFTNNILVPALDVPLIPEAPMAKEIIEYAVDNVPTLVMLESEFYSGKTMLVNPTHYQRMTWLAYLGLAFIAFMIFKIVQKIIS